MDKVDLKKALEDLGLDAKEAAEVFAFEIGKNEDELHLLTDYIKIIRYTQERSKRS